MKAARRVNSRNLSFEVVEVPAQEGALDDLLDSVVDLLVRKWIEKGEEKDEGCRGLRGSSSSRQT